MEAVNTADGVDEGRAVAVRVDSRGAEGLGDEIRASLDGTLLVFGAALDGIHVVRHVRAEERRPILQRGKRLHALTAGVEPEDRRLFGEAGIGRAGDEMRGRVGGIVGGGLLARLLARGIHRRFGPSREACRRGLVRAVGRRLAGDTLRVGEGLPARSEGGISAALLLVAEGIHLVHE